MASAASKPIAAEAASEADVYTLQIISPSVGVPQPLALRGVPAATTVRQLKEKIRIALDAKPTDQAQRLIHRGRLLGRDDETMLELFGEEALRSTDHQSLHLVLRDLSDVRPAFTPAPPSHVTAQPPPTLGQQQPQQPQPLPPQHQHQHQHHHHLPYLHAQPQVRVGVGPPQHPNAIFGFPQAQFGGVNPGSQLPAGWTPQHAAQNHRQMMAALGMGMGNQNQQNHAPIGFGMQDMPAPQGRGTPGTSTPGRNASPFQPDATRTVVREGIGPNGQQWRITVNESVTNPLQRPGRTGSPFSADMPVAWGPPLRSTPSAGQLSGNDVQNVLRSADATSATRTMTDAMRRNASSPSLANLATNPSYQPIPPGVTTPLVQSRTGSAAGTPDPLRAAARSRNAPTSHPQAQSSLGAPEVYILSSPSGPRALLLNSSVDTYFSPQMRGNNQTVGFTLQQRPFAPPLSNMFNMPYAVPPQIFQPPRSPMGTHIANPQQIRMRQPQQPQPQQHGLPQPPRAQPQLGHAMARPDNPQIQAVRIAQVWPHVWMVIRLALFIWWFTSPSSSWSRWITVISIAITLFLVNTGLLNPIAEQIWVPVRRHLENLIPLADGPGAHHNAHLARVDNAQDANGYAANRDLQRDPNPADTAARLVQRRRQNNANWLLNQARRLERAGLLFLASIAPGVAERHIAHLEAEARAERQRREEAEAATAAAAAPSDNTGTTEGEQNNENNSSSDSEGANGGQTRTAGDENAGNDNPPAAEEPLVAV